MANEFLGKYHLWAGNQSRKQLEKLTDEEFSKNLGSTIGSIQDKVEHIILAIESCCRRITYDSSPPDKLVEGIKRMSKKELLTYWEQRDHQIANGFQQATKRNMIIERMNGSSFLMNLNDFYLQYVLHTVYHRGQLNYCLKKLNKERIEADYLYFFDELNIQEE
ncbi:MAG: DinB family protein [Promethearchaeota archaeon]